MVVLLLRDRLRRPGMLLWSVLALYGAGRFVMFFYRSDARELAFGLNQAQWVSLALIAAAGFGAWWSARSSADRRAEPPPPDAVAEERRAA